MLEGCEIFHHRDLELCYLPLLCSPRSELTSENLKWLENVFRRTVGENGEIRLKDFKNIVHSKNVSHGTSV